VEKIATRPVRLKREREGDTGHVIRGIGYSSHCSCGWRSPVKSAWNEAMQAGREHAAEH
jgi:hypothetical protein